MPDINQEWFNCEKFNFSVQVVAASPIPQTLVYLAMHQCYSSHPVTSTKLPESECGNVIVKRLLDGNKGHYSPFEAATITLSLQNFNHGTLQQLLRSRIGVSPAVQSFRYTCDKIKDFAEGKIDVQEIIYLRPPGKYAGRDGIFEYTEAQHLEDVSLAQYCVRHVAKRLKEGIPPEQARGLLNFDYRQQAYITLNARSMMAILDRRSKKDAQKEIQVLAWLLAQVFEKWMPETFKWYSDNRLGKAILAP